MKKLIIIALVLIGFQANAQEDKKENKMKFKKERVEKLANMNAKDVAQIKTKKMTLHLDLTDAQQQKVGAVILKNTEAKIAKAKARLKAGDKAEKPTEQERLKMTNERLDMQIAAKREMKTLLSPEQYEKWEKHLAKAKRKGHGKKRMQRGKKNRKTEKV